MSKLSTSAHLIATLALVGLRPDSDTDSADKIASKVYDAVNDIVTRAQQTQTHLGENGRTPSQAELREIFQATGLEATMPNLYERQAGLISNLQIFRVDDSWRIRFGHEFFSANTAACANFLSSWATAAKNRDYWQRFGPKNSFGAYLEIGVAPMKARA